MTHWEGKNRNVFLEELCNLFIVNDPLNIFTVIRYGLQLLIKTEGKWNEEFSYKSTPRCSFWQTDIFMT